MNEKKTLTKRADPNRPCGKKKNGRGGRGQRWENQWEGGHRRRPDHHRWRLLLLQRVGLEQRGQFHRVDHLDKYINIQRATVERRRPVMGDMAVLLCRIRRVLDKALECGHHFLRFIPSASSLLHPLPPILLFFEERQRRRRGWWAITTPSREAEPPSSSSWEA